MPCSVAPSRLLVASSSSRIGASFRSARASAIRWAWPPEQVLAAARHLGVVAVEQARDKVVGVGEPRHARDVLDRRVGQERDVLGHRLLQQLGVLEDRTDRTTELLRRDAAGADAVDPYVARRREVEPGDQVGQGRLARPGLADDGDGLPRLDREAHVLEHRRVATVSERHAVELDPAADSRQRRRVAVRSSSAGSARISSRRSTPRRAAADEQHGGGEPLNGGQVEGHHAEEDQ